jgi:hypothetical protein
MNKALIIFAAYRMGRDVELGLWPYAGAWLVTALLMAYGWRYLRDL